ncbi:hypothetical protein AAG906_007462 [Vitis piasezkii]
MSSLPLRSILETSKLVGANYDDWYRNRGLFSSTKTYQVLGRMSFAKCIMLASMSPKLEHLKKMYGGQSRTARYRLSKALLRSSLCTLERNFLKI